MQRLHWNSCSCGENGTPLRMRDSLWYMRSRCVPSTREVARARARTHTHTHTHTHGTCLALDKRNMRARTHTCGACLLLQHTCGACLPLQDSADTKVRDACATQAEVALSCSPSLTLLQVLYSNSDATFAFDEKQRDHDYDP
jgi:hypothetical protein